MSRWPESFFSLPSFSVGCWFSPQSRCSSHASGGDASWSEGDADDSPSDCVEVVLDGDAKRRQPTTTYVGDEVVHDREQSSPTRAGRRPAGCWSASRQCRPCDCNPQSSPRVQRTTTFCTKPGVAADPAMSPTLCDPSAPRPSPMKPRWHPHASSQPHANVAHDARTAVQALS